jgi:hypothetical protein
VTVFDSPMGWAEDDEVSVASDRQWYNNFFDICSQATLQVYEFVTLAVHICGPLAPRMDKRVVGEIEQIVIDAIRHVAANSASGDFGTPVLVPTMRKSIASGTSLK